MVKRKKLLLKPRLLKKLLLQLKRHQLKLLLKKLQPLKRHLLKKLLLKPQLKKLSNLRLAFAPALS